MDLRTDGASSPEHDATEQLVTCPICPHRCALREGERGRCRARMVYRGRVVDENYAHVTALALDPIEKKPLYHFHPGASVLSVGSYGCNLACPFCQNADIAQAGFDEVGWRKITPTELAVEAIALRDEGNIGLAYTYNEPLVGYEFVMDCARLIHGAGMFNVLVSNGMINPGPLSRLTSLIDAANIDLKGPDQSFYDLVDGDFEAVRRTIAALAESPNCHLEVTTLIIPGLNDSDEAVESMAAWLSELDPGIPYHLSRFFPCHEMRDRAPTSVGRIYQLVELAQRHLRYVYPGNC